METEAERRARMISALVEDMLRLAPLIPPPRMRQDVHEDARAWAQTLAVMADFLYDAAEASVDCELAQNPDFTVPTARDRSN